MFVNLTEIASEPLSFDPELGEKENVKILATILARNHGFWEPEEFQDYIQSGFAGIAVRFGPDRDILLFVTFVKTINCEFSTKIIEELKKSDNMLNTAISLYHLIAKYDLSK
ncbi:hypothetical protein TVAG_216480 [Trichomonas vaginalis G3]|uniref:Uncharacterized protein n=1 Tax=Trichomonas vaginalis (strain ATCC PRA-98 / G3) TaxID=412133 RepID=A2ENY2_TRIV3|nr:hypothetical protein TVAGG3_0249670 [Trichomonas vaginalis G3]EAY05672.1 hypothetical protein TVAG_216480 [Trichomonas vaginalis G3]KAI5553912.1 hypothetical protein TVAGG3_0249670 [Trichomonas vaginalis G3]|eukprot:XP_001317895.1 hypothetical protein [Trichomonas vaginalis G3]